jgi:hypothetical protein
MEKIIKKSSMKADPVIVICALVIKAKQCVRVRTRAFVAEKSSQNHPKIIHEGGSCYCNLRFGNKREAVSASSSFVAGRSGVCFWQSKRSGGKAAATERETEKGRVFHDVRLGASWPVAAVCDRASPRAFVSEKIIPKSSMKADPVIVI